MRRTFSTIVLLLALIVPVLAACGQSAATTPPTAAPAAPTTAPAEATTAPAATAAPAEATAAPAATAAPEATAATGGAGGALKIGMVTDIAKLGDKSFNDSAWKGVQDAAKALGVEPKVIETTDPNDYEKNIGQFVSEGYNVIVTVGFNLGEQTIAAAKANPDVKFIGVDQFQTDTIPNLAGLNFNEDQAGYLAGMLAAGVSKSDKIGAILGTDAVPPVWRYGEGYRAGAKSVKSDINVQTVYHNDVGFDKTFSDPEWGKATALSMIDQGVDIVFGAGGRTGNGALLAAEDRKAKNVYA
ncbi:MAG TPA: BMP family ABC transporter substrate-binding protein, partial [Roseiflexaceae bacterium]